jgi:hypothetical protein
MAQRGKRPALLSPTPDESMMNNVSAAGLIGMSFSGSTVLNYVLGAHKGVYGGSELYRLISKDPAQHCGCCWCNTGCPTLTPKRISSMDERYFYAALAEFTGRDKIVDTSKNLSWFEHIFPIQKGQGIDLSLILLTKHPLRQLAAYMGFEHNYLYQCGLRSVLKRALVDPATALSPERMHLSYWLDSMIRFYDDYDASVLTRDFPHTRIKYEEFVEHTAQALSPTLERWGLDYDEHSTNYWEYEQHGVGGNRGVISMISNEEQMEVFRSRSTDYILNYYDNRTGLTMDDSFREAFSARTVAWLTSLPRYRMLCERLSYPPTLD